MLAPRKAWKYSLPPSARLRVEQRGQWSLREQWCSVPSSAIRVRPPRRWNGASTARRLDRLDEQLIEGRHWGTIQHLADVIVTGDGGDAEQALAVRASLPRRQGTLMGQERGAAH